MGILTGYDHLILDFWELAACIWLKGKYFAKSRQLNLRHRGGRIFPYFLSFFLRFLFPFFFYFFSSSFHIFSYVILGRIQWVSWPLDICTCLNDKYISPKPNLTIKKKCDLIKTLICRLWYRFTIAFVNPNMGMHDIFKTFLW